MARAYFNAYHSYLKSIDPLNDAERGRLFTALLEYSNTGVIPELRGNERFIFPTMKEQIDRDSKCYEDQCEKNRRNIEKRWNESIRSNTTVYDRIPDDTKNTKEKEKEKEKEKVKEKEGKKARPRFVPPTLDDVRAYVFERGSNVDPVKFFDYFSAGDWIDSKGQPVRNWKQKIITWEKDEIQCKQQKSRKAQELDDAYAMSERWANG